MIGRVTDRDIVDVFDPRRALGIGAGLALTSASLSSGFIWAYEGRAPLVVAAATGAWLGYLAAHYAATGAFVDDGDADADAAGAGAEGWVRYAGIAAGVAVLVAGMYVGVFTIRAGDHLLTNVGGALFLGGYVVAHQAATGRPL